MILRVRQPGGINRDSENEPASARMHGYVAGASRYGGAPVPIGGAFVVPEPIDERAAQLAAASARYRARQRGAA